jgi:hypothetical protein
MAHVTPHHQKAHDRCHARHHGIHADEFRQKAFAHIFPVGAAHHAHHEQGLENEEAEGEPATYSTIRSSHIGRPSAAVTAAARMMPVASPATQ